MHLSLCAASVCTAFAVHACMCMFVLEGAHLCAHPSACMPCVRTCAHIYLCACARATHMTGLTAHLMRIVPSTPVVAQSTHKELHINAPIRMDGDAKLVCTTWHPHPTLQRRFRPLYPPPRPFLLHFFLHCPPQPLCLLHPFLLCHPPLVA